MSLTVDEFLSMKCQVLSCRRVVWVAQLSVDEKSVDGLSPHRIRLFRREQSKGSNSDRVVFNSVQC
jgi:hypothetical protein